MTHPAIAALVSGLARALWCDALMSAQTEEEEGRLTLVGELAGLGGNLFYTAPETPHMAICDAWRIIGAWESKAGYSLPCLMAHFVTENDSEKPENWTESAIDWEKVGWYLGMGSVLGHGVGLHDDYRVPPTWEHAGNGCADTCVFEYAPQWVADGPTEESEEDE